MQVFRISLKKWSKSLIASGMGGRWNSDGMRVIYTAESRSLACLENVVHRSGEGLNAVFNVLAIEIPDDLNLQHVDPAVLNKAWYKSVRCPKCRQLGDKWLKQRECAILKVPSAIIKGEWNYLLNPAHTDFERISIVGTEPFEFDSRIKMV
ncbi:MAG: RES domain-containing protein [Bacteroidetes bacterium]|nr:RES domain-containing protein [Bacteroidota bacterium]